MALHRRHTKQRDTLRLLHAKGHPRVTPRLYEDRLRRGMDTNAALQTAPNACEQAQEQLARWITMQPMTPLDQFCEAIYATALLMTSANASPLWRYGSATYTCQTGIVEYGRS